MDSYKAVRLCTDDSAFMLENPPLNFLAFTVVCPQPIGRSMQQQNPFVLKRALLLPHSACKRKPFCSPRPRAKGSHFGWYIPK